MKVDFTVTYTAQCEIEDAFNDYEELISWENSANPVHADPERAIYEAIEENLVCPRDAIEHLPQDVIEQFATALKQRIGGVQLEMEGVR
jgi:hypothetical protein